MHEISLLLQVKYILVLSSVNQNKYWFLSKRNQIFQEMLLKIEELKT